MIDEELKMKMLSYEREHPEECSDHWRCTLCNWEIYLNEPHCIGAFCCGKCGMTTLRPAKEVLNQDM